MARRKRDVPVLFWVSAEEQELIRQKMEQFGTENMSAYLRILIAFLISPMGLPLAAIWLLGKVQDLKYAIQDRVYG